MAVTVEECRQMIAAARKAHVKLMVAYRRHFEALSLVAIDVARRGELGDLKFFNASSMSRRKSADQSRFQQSRRRDAQPVASGSRVQAFENLPW